MAIFSVRDATLDDEPGVVSLLSQVLSGRPEAYAGIFRFARSSFGRDSTTAHRPLGAVLVRNDGNIAGFLGLLSSRQARLSSGWIQHMTSWAVAADARSQGLRLLHHVAADRSAVLVNLSGTAAVQTILPRFGYQVIDVAELTFGCLSLSGAWRRLSCRLKTAGDAAASIGDPEQAAIFRDHLAMGCHAFAFESDGRTIAGLLLKRGGGFRPTAQLIHLTPADPDARGSIWPVLTGYAAVDLRCPRLLVDARHAPPASQPLATKKRRMFARGLEVAPHEMTRAYGEPLHAEARLLSDPEA